jgi:uncharacterized protein (TIGR02271 family)
MGHKGETERFQVTEEEARIGKRVVPTGRVRIHTAVDVKLETACANLEEQEVHIDRVPVNKPIKEIPSVRTKNDTLIIPVMEEVLVVEKQLILKEELHVRRRGVHKRVEVPVSVRKQRPVVGRLNAGTDDANYKRAMDILDRAGAVDMDQRAETWRKEGWKDHSATAEAGHTAMENRTPAAGSAATRSASGEQSIPLVEEQLQIGKRETGHGRVRIRSYVVEKPVSEQVTLKDEHVSVQRKPVDRPVAPGEGGLQERTVELTETREEPVVSKHARVKEEVTLRKEAGQRTETVSDKVKRTEVKIEDERGRGPAQPTRKAG